MSSAYTLIYYGNSTVNNSITVPDGEANTIANLSFPGRNFSGYGSPVDQNFLSLVENFASRPEGPANPVVGQFWMDAANLEMCYNGAGNNETGTDPQWRSLLYREIDSSNPANTVTSLAKVGKVVVGNIANTNPDNRTIEFDANGSGNIKTGGNLIIGDRGDGSDPTHGNITISDSGNIATQGSLAFEEWYDTSGANYPYITLNKLTSSGNATGNIITNMPSNGTVAYTRVQTLNVSNTSNVISYAEMTSAGDITATGNVALATSGNSSVTIGSQAAFANNTQVNPVLKIYGDLEYHGNLNVFGPAALINAQTTTVSDPVMDIGAAKNNAPLALNDGLDRGLAFHTYGVGAQFTTSGVTANNTNLITLTDVTGIVANLRVGYDANSTTPFSLDTFVSNVWSGNKTIQLSANTTSSIASGEKINIGLDNVHFMGWDATDQFGGGEFKFTNNTVEASVINNWLNGNANGQGAISGTMANIRAGNAAFEGNVTVTGNILPTAGTYTIGSASSVWANVNATTVGVVSGLNYSASANFSSLSPSRATTLHGDGGNITGINVQNSNIYAYLNKANTTLPDIKAASIESSTNITAAGTVSGSLLTGTITTATQPNVTSLGTLVGLTVNGDTTIDNGRKLITTNITTGGPATAGKITGAWTLDGTFEATYADLAERHHADGQYATGSVMTVGGINEITGASEGNRVLGVVSDAWAYLMNGSAGPQETHPAVAYVGRVPVRVVGPVKKHDRVSPFKDGVAVASESNSFGWAIETNEEPGEKLVMCIIK